MLPSAQSSAQRKNRIRNISHWELSFWMVEWASFGGGSRWAQSFLGVPLCKMLSHHIGQRDGLQIHALCIGCGAGCLGLGPPGGSVEHRLAGNSARTWYRLPKTAPGTLRWNGLDHGGCCRTAACPDRRERATVVAHRGTPVHSWHDLLRQSRWLPPCTWSLALVCTGRNGEPLCSGCQSRGVNSVLGVLALTALTGRMTAVWKRPRMH